MNRETIDAIKTTADLVALATASGVSLTKSGNKHTGCCPFHADSSPSFVIYPDNRWHCFGCQRHGDVISFAMGVWNVGFTDACKQLARDNGITVTGEPDNKALEMLEQAACSMVTSRDGAEIRYLVERGVSIQTMIEWKIGACHDGLFTHMWRQFPNVQPVEYGLTREFAGRIVIPITDAFGHVIGFAGRALDGRKPKWINSPASSHFNKSAVLFGLNKAKKSIREHGYAYVVEGYLDCIVMHQYGFQNTVAIMGTALTEQQVMELSNYCDRILLVLDGDCAGMAAVLRAIKPMTGTGLPLPTFDPFTLIRYENRARMSIEVARLPDGYDPDQYLIDYQANGFAELVHNTKDSIVQVVLDDLAKHHRPDQSRKQAKEYAQAAMEIVAQVADSMDRAHYTETVSQYTGISVDMLIEHYGQPKNSYLMEVAETLSTVSNRDGIEACLLATFLCQPDVMRYVNEKLSPWGMEIGAYLFEDTEYSIAYEHLVSGKPVLDNPTLATLYNHQQYSTDSCIDAVVSSVARYAKLLIEFGDPRGQQLWSAYKNYVRYA